MVTWGEAQALLVASVTDWVGCSEQKEVMTKLISTWPLLQRSWSRSGTDFTNILDMGN